jgi:hypothetical protein
MKGTAAVLVVILGLSVSSSFVLVPSRAHAQTCPANSESYSTEQTAAGTVTHCQCISGYVLSNGSC